MILFDLIMKPADSYWKKQYNSERVKRQRAEADAKCYKDEADYNNETVALLSDRDLKQARAIEAYNKQIEEMRQQLKQRDHELQERANEIRMLKETLAAERRASKVYQMTEKLWNEVKEARA